MPAYSKQLEDEDGNILYPVTTAGSVVDSDSVDLQTRVDTGVYTGTGNVGSLSPWVDTSDIMDGAVTEDKIDWSSVSPCVSRFMFTGDSMPSPSQDIVKQTLRGTSLTFHISNNSIYISSGADNIQKAHYSISYSHPVANGNYGIIGVKPNSRSYGYFTGYLLSGAVNTFNNGIYTDTDQVYGDLLSSTGDKDSFHAEFDIIRSLSNTTAPKNNLWFMFGHIQSSYNTFALDMRCECTATNNSTIPSVYQRGANATYYSIVVEVYEE